VKRCAFSFLLRDARRYAPYRENLKTVGLKALFLVRRIFLEEGARLARRGRIPGPEDVFFLEIAELDRAVASAVATEDLRPVVAARRAERQRQLALEPPPRPSVREKAVLAGVPVSGGRARGRARVLRSIEDAARLEPGDVLVARAVNAAWTPCFGLVSAVVAEVGGVLSHGAIMAREYGLPCVFGVVGATGTIRDGEGLQVDGDLGTVTVEPDR
jgi:pyruvate,water dikinase